MTLRAWGARPISWLRRRYVVVLGIASLIGVWFGITWFRTSERTSWVCTACMAHRRDDWWGLGWANGPGSLFQVTSETIDAHTRTAVEVFARKHEHRWVFFGSQSYFLGVKNGISCGSPRWNPLTMAYDSDDFFRDRVRAEVAAGRLTWEEMRSLCELPGHPEPEDLQSPSRRELFARGLSILAAAGSDRGYGWRSALEASRR